MRGTDGVIKGSQTADDQNRADQFPLLDHIESGILAIDRDATIVLWNKNMEQWCDLSRDQVLGQNLYELFPNTNADAFKICIEQVLTGGAPVIFSPQQHYHVIPCPLANGEFRKQQVTVTWLQDYQVALFSIQDQTEQIRLIEQYKQSALSLKSELDQRQKLEKKNMQLAAAIDQAGEAVIITDIYGQIEYANHSFVEQTGWRSDEINTVGYFDTLIEKSENHVNQQLKLSIKAEEAWVGRQNIVRRDGSSFTASISIAPIIDGDGALTHHIIIQEDISQYISLEEKMRDTQKQEALITLIGGIAHDFNNLLAGLIGQVYLASREVSHLPKTAERMKKIQASAQDAAEIVKQLLTFARQGEHFAKEFSLSSFMNEFVKLARHNVPENIKLISSFERGAVHFRGDANQLQLSLLNIVQNAVDACKDVEAPQIEITLTPFNSSAHGELLKKYPVLRHGNFAHVLIRDNGKGIPENMIDRIFDPFFSTKQLGSGLGLAMVMGCVRHHHGIIDVESKPGHGSSFHLFLPTLMPQKIALIDTDKTFAEGINILLVDDDERVLESTKELLECMGHEVTIACDGRAACRAFEEQSDLWDILITDIVMPHMDGVAASKKMRLLRPDLPVIYATGYDQSLVTEETRNMNNTILISKPFNPDDLDRLISKLVNK
ncbi:MAG: PAS domain S-box protein [Mariprofundus sp.]|nr:PAS domain S-box protein [Mariprofundus sp.]